MNAIFTGGITRIYIGALLFATHFLLISCAKIAPTQPEVKENTTPNPMTTQAYTPPVPQTEPFNITIKGLTDPRMSAYGGSIVRAVQKWEKVIVEGLPDIGEVDDVVIEFKDGGKNEKLLASASPSWRHIRYGSGLSYYGTVTIYDTVNSLIDVNDIPGSLGDIEKVIFHEIGHILAFDYWALTTGGQGDKLKVVNGAHFFTGERAIDAYREALYQQGEKLAYAIPDLLLPLEPDSFHWRYPALKWDVMSPYFHTDNVLTAVTICALEDIGYTVDMSQAEDPKPWRLTKPTLGHPFFCDGTHVHTVSEREQ